jgi:hypothetical protein
MRKKTLLTLLALIALSCKPASESAPQQHLKVKSQFSANSLSQLSAFNLQNANANVLLRYSASLTDWGSGNTTPTAIANAVFTNDSVPEMVNTVTINGHTLHLDSSSYIYDSQDPAAFSTPNSVDWSIMGYEGNTFSDNSSKPSTLTIISPHPGDTVSATSELALN